ncbi:MAG: hypothetical protein II839_03520, partial [Kiritimatiellae bacterium]|nr:hypothetical protein [Kiritimatiellia bacterium]
GGGVVHATKVLLEPGVYAVTIGAGGTMASSATSSKTPGGNSLITSEGGATTNFIAYGGGCGVGWDDNTATGSSGASGGGGARNRKGTDALAVYGQGHVGGDPQNDYRPGGGGGAGTKGANGSASGVTPSGAGAGGAGLAFSITGTRVVYGSGGGGGARSNADVMAPGGENGGNGAYWTVPATAGVDGTGGGGGGGCNASAATRIAGNGGSGVVIIRYTDFSLAGDAPVLAVHPDDATVAPCSVVLPIDVTSAGTGASTVSLAAAWGYAADDLSVGSTALSDFIGSGEISAAGLLPGTECFFSIVADNGQSGGTATWTGSIATAPMFSEPLAYTAAGGVLGYTVDGAATADSQRLELWVGPDASSMTNQATYTDASLLAAGAHTIQPFATEQFGETLSILLRHVAVVGSLAFTNETAVLSTTIADGATYTWKSDVADGLWCDAANWTASVAGGRGWPTAGSTAKFPNAVVTCRVDRAVVASTITYTASGSTTFLGTDEDAAIALSALMDLPQDGTVVFDGIALRSPENIKFANGATLRFQNGSAATVAKFDAGSLSGWTTFEVKSSTVTGSLEARNLDVVLESATFNSTGLVNLLNNSSQNGARLRFKDGILRFVSENTVYSGNISDANHTKAAVILDLAANGGYSTTDALIRMTKKDGRALCNSGGPIVFSCPTTEGSKKLAGCEILVADWSVKTGSPMINTALVEFGEVDREGSYFYYTQDSSPFPKDIRRKSAEEVAAAGETAKYLWYHHAPFPATVLIVK